MHIYSEPHLAVLPDAPPVTCRLVCGIHHFGAHKEFLSLKSSVFKEAFETKIQSVDTDLLVQGLPACTTEDAIRNRFGIYGDIVRITMRDGTRNISLIHFASAEAVREVVASRPVHFEGIQLHVDHATTAHAEDDDGLPAYHFDATVKPETVEVFLRCLYATNPSIFLTPENVAHVFKLGYQLRMPLLNDAVCTVIDRQRHKLGYESLFEILTLLNDKNEASATFAKLTKATVRKMVEDQVHLCRRPPAMNSLSSSVLEKLFAELFNLLFIEDLEA